MTYEVVNVTPRRTIEKYPKDAKCSVEDCAGRPISRGLCNAHRIRLRDRGTLDLPEPLPIIDRLLARVEKPASGCWEWTGATNNSGYGVIGRGRRGQGTVLVHRASFEHYIGLIPAGLHVDHLCRNKRCVNPDHLEAVTQAENNRRMRAAKRSN